MSHTSVIAQVEQNGHLNVEPMLNGLPVVPVVVLDNAEQAIGLAQTLVKAKLPVIEVTLRNDYGLEAIRLIKAELPEMLVMAGTVTNQAQMLAVIDAGGDAIISPGISESLLKTATDKQIPYLPGIATPSEAMLALQYGLQECKLFPATVVGGVGALKAMGGPFPSLRFCPTGGINEENYQEFLALSNVMCVGGSWIAPSSLIKAQDWQAIEQRCLTLAESL